MSHLVGNPEDRFSRVTAHFKEENVIQRAVLMLIWDKMCLSIISKKSITLLLPDVCK